jgi:hypothetical protein
MSSDLHCERCGASLNPDNVTWLSLRTSDNGWLPPGTLAEHDPDNQGCFPFGSDCAKRALNNGQDW